MLKKTYILGILTATTLGMLPFTAEASTKPCCQSNSRDNAVVQTSRQSANVTGKGNAVAQNANQSVNAVAPSNSRVHPTRTNRRTPTRTHVRRPARRPATSPCK